MTVEQVMDIVQRDMSYYKNSGGGVTFSGGEPTMQPRFLLACLKKCKQIGINTALDTCGLAKWPVFDEILPYIDLFLYDIKEMDSEKHKQLTGVGNELILENLRRISERGKPVWIRIPLIPGYNDSEKDLRRTAEFIKQLKGIRKVSLLPYNEAAAAKYQFMGQNYKLADVVACSKEREAELVDIFSCLGIEVELGR